MATAKATVTTIAVTGSSGLIGSALIRQLESAGHRVLRLVRERSADSADRVYWNPLTKECDISRLQETDAFINLAGENIGKKRWTPRFKKTLRESRLQSTAFLVELISRLERRPRVLLSASAVGYYGSKGDLLIDEDSPAGSGFLAELAREWEAAAAAASDAAARVVLLRFGLVLSREGGALRKMLLPFYFGGGRLGNGRQYLSWISSIDATRALIHCLHNSTLTGAVNIVSPDPVTNAEFSRTLGAVLKTPAVLHAPAPLLRWLVGELADDVLLASARVVPKRLLNSGFSFKHHSLREALTELLDR